MRRLLPILFLPALLTAQTDRPPNHFFRATGRLTPASARPAREIARAYLRSVAGRYRLVESDLAGVEIAKEYRTAHNGVTHFVYRQRFMGLDVFNGAWAVNIDREGRVINSGGNLYPAPAPGVAVPAAASALRAVRSAARAVNPRVAERYAPFQTAAPDVARRRLARFSAGGFGDDLEGQPVWYGNKGALAPAWLFYVTDEDRVGRYYVAVDETSQATLAKVSLTRFDGPKGMVFPISSPQPNPALGLPLTAPPPFIQRTLTPFTGDPLASPAGWVAGSETAGNNAIVGLNPLGTYFAPPVTAKAINGDFSFPLELGPGAPPPTRFSDAAVTSVFYWVNRAHDLFYALGFDESAGNYQQENFGNGGLGGDPMYAYAQYGVAGLGGARTNNAFYTTTYDGDGAQSMVAFYVGLNDARTLFTDAAYDPEVMVHEYTHGVTTRLVPLFYNTFQGGAMGEAFSDFFGMELTLPDGGAVDGAYPNGAYFTQDFTSGVRSRPYSANMAINPLTFTQFGAVEQPDPRVDFAYPEVHADGEIWTEALWEVRAELVRQFGEKTGRQYARLLMVDALTFAPPAPSMIDMRDAILVADYYDFGGDSYDRLWQAFARRGFGVMAQSTDGDSVHIVASYAAPSDKPQLGFYDAAVSYGEPLRVALYDGSTDADSVTVRLTTSCGDVEDVSLYRSGFLFTGTAYTSESYGTKGNGTLNLVPGDVIAATYASGGNTAQATAMPSPRYYESSAAQSFAFQNERALGLRSSGLAAAVVSLPFPFPFYEKTYSAAVIYNDGMLSFGGGQLSFSSTDVTEFPLRTAVAPLWIPMSTSGSAQPNEDIYMSSTADSVTFRWASQLSTTSGTSEPLNFAATLFRNGRIEFHYGAGNRNLAALTGSGPVTPLIGLAMGHEIWAHLAGRSFSLNLDSASTVVLDPPFDPQSNPRASIESPAPGQHVRNSLVVSGIRYDPALPVARMDLLIDGVPVSRSASSMSRTDFCTDQNVIGCPYVGYLFSVNPITLGIKPGQHGLQVRVTNSRGAFNDIPGNPIPFTVDSYGPAPVTAALESPADGQTLSGTVAVRGYAYSADLRVSYVDLLIDGITYASPSLSLSRTDVCNTLPSGTPGCPYVGFSYNLNTRTGAFPLVNGDHFLWIRVRDELGNYTTFPEKPLKVTVQN